MMLVDDYKHRGMRKTLVRTVRSKGIRSEKVLKALEKVPRHYFFEPAFLEHAYQDKAFPIGEGQTISQPYTVAFQTELLDINPGDKVLEIGTGSGYQACILIELGAKVYSVECVKKLFEKTRKFLPRMGYRPHMTYGDGTMGWKSQAPFDKILVTAAAPRIPASLIDQLAVGGYLVIPVGSKNRQRMVRVHKKNESKLVKEEFSYFCFVPLIGEEGWAK